MRVAGKFALAALTLLAAPIWAQQGGDYQAQILYAFHTEDANGLTNLVQDLSTQVKADAGDASLRYHLAHALYRRGLLAGSRNSREADASFSDCVDQLKPVLAKDAMSVEALVLQAACYRGLAEHRRLEAVLLRSRAEERLKAALDLAPRNPRALFLSSVDELRRARPESAERQRAFERLQLAAQLFDASSATSIDTPGWGHAEAYLALGEELKARRDHLGARNWIEKSLLAAPDFKAAQRQLAQLEHPRS